jgi:hypothetical protein
MFSWASTRKLKKSFAFVIAIAVASAPGSAFADCQGPHDNDIQEATDEYRAVKGLDSTNAALATPAPGAEAAALSPATSLGTVAAGNCAQATLSSNKIKSLLNDCISKCSGPDPKDKNNLADCNNTIKPIYLQVQSATMNCGVVPQAAATKAAVQGSPGGSASSSGGLGNMGSSLSSMAPLAMAGAAAAMMMMKKNSDTAATAATTATIQANGFASPDGVVQANGQVDCTQNLAYRYTECNTTVAPACMANINTMTSSQVCENFGARYCNTGAYVAPQVYSPYPYPLQLGQVIGNQVVTQLPPAHQVDVIGEGVGTTYCLRTLQINFCGAAANASCPSCLQLANLRSTACVANPAVCNVQSSASAVNSQIAACPSSDPLLSIPGALPLTTATATTAPATTVITTTPTTAPAILPVPILPTGNVAATTTTTAASAGSAGGSAGGGFVGASTASVASIGSGAGAGKEGTTTGSFADNAVLAQQRAVAAFPDRTVASGSAGVAAEVAPAMGPSLFSTASQPIIARCNSGQLNYCLR